MAIVKNPLLKQVRGSLNKQVVLRQVGENTVMSAHPDFSDRKLSPKQKKSNVKFAEATAAAKDILYDPVKCAAAQVRLNITRNKVFNALVSEFMKGETPV